MPISVTCPECNSAYKVADEAAGKAIKCKKCGARVPVQAAAADDDLTALDTGKSNNGDGEGGEPAKPKKKSNTTLIIAIAAGLIAFCCVCVPGGSFATWWFGFRNTAPQNMQKIVDDALKKGGVKNVNK